MTNEKISDLFYLLRNLFFLDFGISVRAGIGGFSISMPVPTLIK